MAETSVAETSGMPWELSKLPNLGPGIGQYVLGTEDIFPLKVTDHANPVPGFLILYPLENLLKVNLFS